MRDASNPPRDFKTKSKWNFSIKLVLSVYDSDFFICLIESTWCPSGVLQNRARRKTGNSPLWRQYENASVEVSWFLTFFGAPWGRNMVLSRCVVYGCSNTHQKKRRNRETATLAFSYWRHSDYFQSFFLRGFVTHRKWNFTCLDG